MSSPLSMLKKTRRAPLPGAADHRNNPKVPFKRNPSPEFEEASVPDGSSELRPPLSSHVSANTASTSKCKPSHKRGSAPTDFELMSVMMQQVVTLKQTVIRQAQEIKSRDKKISALEKKLKIQNQSGSQNDKEDVNERCQQLQNQVYEMENFLSDYGLIWVGDAEEGELSDDEQTHHSDADLQHRDGRFFMNFDLVLQRIRDLNILAGEGESFVQKTARGAQLAQKEPIDLRLYSNGIVMFDGPFRSYQERCTQQCMTELMDGCFPSELRDRFPDGSPFKAYDRRDEEFIPKPQWEPFPGVGRAVRGGTTPSATTASFNPKQDQFLSKLPKMVVKSGRVIMIREPIRVMMQGGADVQSSSSVVLIETPALKDITEGPLTSIGGYKSSPCDIITLKVRSEDGDKSFIVKMRLSETVGHLRKYVDDHRGELWPSAYDIVSAQPQRHYDDAHTLQWYGLTTNTTLLLQKPPVSH